MSSKKVFNPLTAGAGVALVAAALSAPAMAAMDSNPFDLQVLDQGYELGTQLAEGKCGEGKCGEGKCGGEKADKADKEGKCGEGKCGEGKCGGEKADKEGKCGEGKCGH